MTIIFVWHEGHNLKRELYWAIYGKQKFLHRLPKHNIRVCMENKSWSISLYRDKKRTLRSKFWSNNHSSGHFKDDVFIHVVNRCTIFKRFGWSSPVLCMIGTRNNLTWQADVRQSLKILCALLLYCSSYSPYKINIFWGAKIFLHKYPPR